MLSYIITLIFIVSVGIATGSILISYQLRDRYKSDYLSAMMYMQIFFFTFGFYALWGQVFVNSFLSPYVSPDLMKRITNIMVYLGMPFLVFGWFMLIKFTREISGRKNINKIIIWFLILNAMIFFGLGFMINKYAQFQSLALIKYYYFTLNIIYSIIGITFLITAANNRKLHKNQLRNIIFILLVVTILESLLIYFYNDSRIYVALIFILIFFAGNGLYSVYFRYFANLASLVNKPEAIVSIDDFCITYEITSREKDIIVEIYNGLTNQQIADKLFISLQTVKDHTSRIYSKTNTQSRVQLIKILHNLTGK